ncbi:hypothetical protein CCP3SC5AM1_420008 [Gammaproteobacteria bacterium]
MLNSVRAKLQTMVVTIVLVTVTATTLIHAYLFHTHQVWSLQATSLAAGMALSTLLEHLHERNLTFPLDEAEEDINYFCKKITTIHPELASIGVINSKGKRLFGEIPNGINAILNNEILTQPFDEGQPRFFEKRLDPDDENVFSTIALIPINNPGKRGDLVLVVLRSDALAHDLRMLILFSLFTGLLVALVAAILGRWGTDLVVMHPLERLLQAIREVTVRGKGGERMDIGNTKELKILGKSFNDMLERLEQTRLALVSNEKFLEVIVENIPILLEVQDARDLRFVRFNRAGESMLGLRREELLGHTPHEVFTAEAARRYIARDQAILAAGVPVDVPEERIQTKTLGERIFYTQKIPIFDEQRRPMYLLGISEDITERRHIEEVRRFGAFQSGIAEMSVSVLHNIGNAITAVTDDAEQIRRGTEELGRLATLLATDAERTAATLHEDEASQKIFTNEGLNNTVKRLLTVQREVARTIARIHNEGLKEHAERIERNVCHIADIVRIQQGAVLPGGGASLFSLKRVIEDAMVMQGESIVRHDEVHVVVDIDPSVDEITTYRNRLLQALINVLKNGYEAIRERQGENSIPGRIVITGRPIAEGRVELRIVDNGIGIESDHLQDIFHFGYSTKARGSGFGLHSVANFIQEQGGSVEARSAGRNQGTELIIELPLRQTRAMDNSRK